MMRVELWLFFFPFLFPPSAEVCLILDGDRREGSMLVAGLILPLCDVSRIFKLEGGKTAHVPWSYVPRPWWRRPRSAMIARYGLPRLAAGVPSPDERLDEGKYSRGSLGGRDQSHDQSRGNEQLSVRACGRASVRAFVRRPPRKCPWQFGWLFGNRITEVVTRMGSYLHELI
ncbi:hypothetical protein BD289DRAFT_183953 [Coniella lustricola]|uniref:Secreted protein n=1 Tax=Coniella lustricola TaxID=2025994 RepID=A0A2T3ADA5_9PEZI|nr:hypothetical protein BD289DRAFT_183953 [Coniella lustricola]